MYSIVLMVAMTGSAAESPNGIFHHAAPASCTGCTGCMGYAGCTGCTGMAPPPPPRHGLFHHHRAPVTSCSGCTGCYGCCGGGYNCGGCTGGCAGCYGASAMCHGCGGCYGFQSNYGFAGCYGSCYGSYTNYFSYWLTPPSAYGYGMPMIAEPPAGAMPPVVPPPGGEVKPKDKKPVSPEGKGEGLNLSATITVSMPAKATLIANGQRTQQDSAERKFVTPELNPNQRYHYVFTAEMERDGQVVTETKYVEVWAGAAINVNFGTMAAAKPRAEEIPTLVVSPK